MLKTVLVVACVGLVAACSSSKPAPTTGDISKVLDLKSEFGPEYKVKTVAPAGIDPRLFARQALPPGLRYEPPACSKFATGLIVEPGVQGNVAAVAAEGQGNRFIVMAVETSDHITPADPGQNCKKIAFAGPGLRGLVEKVPAPDIDGATTLGTHRVVEAMVQGKPSAGQLYNYVANFGNFLVIITANPLTEPNQPVVPVNTQKATELLTKAVAAVRGK
jgi:hypothetical protein